MNNPNVVYPQQLSTLLDRFPGIKLLTIDCFDTLVWRRVWSPTEVFKLCELSGEWQEFDVTSQQRIKAEAVARRKSLVRGGTGEVSIFQIYREITGWDVDEEGIGRLLKAEWSVELDCCYLHPLVLDFIDQAKNKGIRVSIVSDTYWDAERMRALTASAPVWTSSDHNLSKKDGLLKKVVEKLGVDPKLVLHVGDNRVSDYDAALAAGLNAVLFEPAPYELMDRDRLGVVAAKTLDSEMEWKASRPVLKEVASQSVFVGESIGHGLNKSELVGYATVGPIVAAFAKEIVETSSDDVIDLFIMRDAWLVREACSMLKGKEHGAALEVSRFTAIASSFSGEDEIVAYLATYFGKNVDFKFLARQLLVEDLYVQKIDSDLQEKVVQFSFNEWVLSTTVLNTIVERSRAFFDGLVSHLANLGVHVGPIVDGEGFETTPATKRIRFIDLGYEGTVERTVGNRLRQIYGTEVLAFYLLSLDVLGGEQDCRCGVVSEPTVAVPLVQHVAALEIFCSRPGGSPVRYTDIGAPVLAPDTVSVENRAVVEDVQKAALQFVRDAVGTGWFNNHDATEVVTQCLGRLEFFPGFEEFELMKMFKLEVNLGSDMAIPLVDHERATKSMRRAGFFSAASKIDRRMCVGAELATLGVENSIAYATIVRASLNLTHEDFSRRSMPIVVLVGDERGTMKPLKLNAYSTYDGFFVVDVPPAEKTRPVEVVFDGMQLVQFESTGAIPRDHVYRATEKTYPVDFTFKGLVSEGQGLMRSSGNRSRFIVSAVPAGGVLRLVFRPLLGS